MVIWRFNRMVCGKKTLGRYLPNRVLGKLRARDLVSHLQMYFFPCHIIDIPSRTYQVYSIYPYKYVSPLPVNYNIFEMYIPSVSSTNSTQFSTVGLPGYLACGLWNLKNSSGALCKRICWDDQTSALAKTWMAWWFSEGDLTLLI